MKLNTPVEIPQAAFRMGYKDKSLWIGSCFTENMGGRLSGLKFNVTLNPSGIIYNPLSILTILKRIRDKKYYAEDELFFSDGLWHSDDHHGSFSHPDPNVCLNNINGKLDDSYEQLQEARFLFITFGNAWYFSSLSSGKGVANCHKRPASCFQKKILSFEEVKNCLEEIQALVSDISTNIRIVYTVSPVRHTAYGATDNMRGKAVLIAALHEAMRNHAGSYYFPAFEIMMDELRDYRYYAEDMLHPSLTAQQIIFDKFTETLIDEDSRMLMKKVESIVLAAAHRPLHPGSPDHIAFATKMLRETEDLQKTAPFLDFSEELNIFQAAMNG